MRKRGPGRPPILKDRKTISVYLDREDYELIMRLADSKNKTLSSIVREAIKYYLRESGLKNSLIKEA